MIVSPTVASRRPHCRSARPAFGPCRNTRAYVYLGGRRRRSARN